MKASFIVPVRNGAAHVGAAIDSISDAVRHTFDYEVIVVDNGSTDGTPAIAARRGATVLSSAADTIGAVRNRGARQAKGEFLIFMDADVTLESGWRTEFMKATRMIRRQPFTFSGSRCCIPHNASWIERQWIQPRRQRTPSYIGTGHFIVGHRDFWEVEGFDETLTTGEDYDLSKRLLSHGGTMLMLSPSIACHHGNPRGLREFMRRESWHGIGDCGSLSSVLRSPVAILALLVGFLHLPVLGWLVGWLPGLVAGMAALAVLGICWVSTLRAYRGAGAAIIVINTALYYCYFIARLTSFLRAHIPALRLGWRRSGRVAA